MLKKILTVFVLCAVFCNAKGNTANASAKQLLGHWIVVTDHNTHRPLNMAQDTCVSIFKDSNENLKFKSGEDLPLFDVAQRTIQNNKEFFIRDGEQEAKLLNVYPNELVWESDDELVVFYRIDSVSHSISKKSPTKKLDETLFDAKSLEYWFTQLPQEHLSNSPQSITEDVCNAVIEDRPRFVTYDKPKFFAHYKPKFNADNKPNSFTRRWERKVYNFHEIPDGEASPRTIFTFHKTSDGEVSPRKSLHYPELGLTKQLDEHLYQKNLHSCRGAYKQAFKKLKKSKKRQLFNLWKHFCMDQLYSEFEYYRTPRTSRKAEINRSFEKCKKFYPRDHFVPRKFSDDTDSSDLSSTRDSSLEVTTVDSENSNLFDNMEQNLDLLDSMTQNMIKTLKNKDLQKCAQCGNILWNSNNGTCTKCTAK